MAVRERLECPVNVVPLYSYYAIVPLDQDGKLRVYDGDTVTLTIDLGLEQWVGPVHYRLFGIQAPEIRPLATRAAGEASRDHLCELIKTYARWVQEPADFPGPGYGLIVRTHKKLRPKRDYRPRACRGKFGRWLVELFGTGWFPATNINQRMIKDGFAEPY